MIAGKYELDIKLPNLIEPTGNDAKHLKRPSCRPTSLMQKSGVLPVTLNHIPSSAALSFRLGDLISLPQPSHRRASWGRAAAVMPKACFRHDAFWAAGPSTTK